MWVLGERGQVVGKHQGDQVGAIQYDRRDKEFRMEWSDMAASMKLAARGASVP